MQRDWNEYPEPERAVPPLEDPGYRAYKAAKAADAAAAAGRPYSLPPPPAATTRRQPVKPERVAAVAVVVACVG